MALSVWILRRPRAATEVSNFTHSWSHRWQDWEGCRACRRPLSRESSLALLGQRTVIPPRGLLGLGWRESSQTAFSKALEG